MCDQQINSINARMRSLVEDIERMQNVCIVPKSANYVIARYVRVQSTKKPQSVHDSVVNLDAILISYMGKLRTPTTGTVSPPQPDPTLNWPNLLAVGGRFAHTGGSGPVGEEYLELDLGADVPVDAIEVHNRRDGPWVERIANYTLRVFNAARTEVYTCDVSSSPHCKPWSNDIANASRSNHALLPLRSLNSLKFSTNVSKLR